jgi:hypothetical protein
MLFLTMQTTPPTPVQPAQPQLLYTAPGWYVPEGKRLVFYARPGVINVYPGWILTQDTQTSQEVSRLQVTPTTQIRGIMGAVVLGKDGKKPGLFSAVWFSFYKPLHTFFAVMPVSVSLIFTFPFVVELGLLTVGVGVMLYAYPSAFKKAKAFERVVEADRASRA